MCYTVVDSTSERSCKARDVTELVISCRACIVCRITNSRILTARVIGKLGAVPQRIGYVFNLSESVVGVGGDLAHRIGNGKRLVERVINCLADDVALSFFL